MGNMYIDASIRTIRKALDLLGRITDNTKFQEIRDELHDNLLALVHFVGDIYARLKANKVFYNVSKDEVELFLAFIYLNNQLKHDPNLEVIYYELSGSMFPMFFPFHFGLPCVCWADFEDHGNNKEATRTLYDKYLKSKDIQVTLEQLEKVIFHYSIVMCGHDEF